MNKLSRAGTRSFDAAPSLCELDQWGSNLTQHVTVKHRQGKQLNEPKNHAFPISVGAFLEELGFFFFCFLLSLMQISFAV